MHARVVTLAFAVARLLAVALATAGCVSYYGGSFRDGTDWFVGTRVALDCLDVTIAPSPDGHANGVVLAYTFGNHCEKPVVVDFRAVRAIGRYADGSRPLHAFDPRHELRPLRLAAGDVAHEVLAYRTDDGSSTAAACIDVGGLEPSAHATAHWMCFGAWDLGAHIAGDSVAPPPTELVAAPISATGWPLPEVAEPEVIEMPISAQRSIADVGAYLATRIHDEHRLLKALHDYVIRSLSYDDAAHERKIERPSQLADDVFHAHVAVCEGYANLLSALGQAAGLDIRTIGGDANDSSGERGPHAWNAAHLAEGWVMIDATWDDIDDVTISTKYFMMPPGDFAATHIPDDPQWALTAPALTFDQFLATRWPVQR